MSLVKKYWAYYRNKVKDYPLLYRSGPDGRLVTVVLPKYLLNWSEKRSGHSGYANKCRPKGIRRYVDDGALALREIFASPESLAAFIHDSDADGMVRFGTDKSYRKSNVKFSFVHYLNHRDQKLLESSAASHAHIAWHDVSIFTKLAAIYGIDTVLEAKRTLTVEEFGLRFGLEMPRGMKRPLEKKTEVRVRRGVGSY